MNRYRRVERPSLARVLVAAMFSGIASLPLLPGASASPLFAQGPGISAVAQPEPSRAALAWARRVVESHDHAGRPFVIVDKRAALVVLHTAEGSIAGVSPALLGRQRGDHSESGVGERTQSGTLRPIDMTTPAGRFLARPGPNRSGETVLWMNEDEALAMHRLRPGRMHALRARALAGSSPSQRRLSAGCVVVPAAFFDSRVMPLFRQRGGIVYVMPETGAEPDPSLALSTSARSERTSSAAPGSSSPATE